MPRSIEISQDDSLLYSVADKQISAGFNAAAGFDGYKPSVQLLYGKDDFDKKGNGTSLSASLTATAGDGIRAGASAIQEWNKPIDEKTMLKIRAGAGIEASTSDGVSAAMKVRADYIRADSISPYFTAAASTQPKNALSVGVGVCKDVEVPVLNTTSTLCGGVEMRGDRPAATFSIGRNF